MASISWIWPLRILKISAACRLEVPPPIGTVSTPWYALNLEALTHKPSPTGISAVFSVKRTPLASQIAIDQHRHAGSITGWRGGGLRVGVQKQGGADEELLKHPESLSRFPALRGEASLLRDWLRG